MFVQESTMRQSLKVTLAALMMITIGAFPSRADDWVRQEPGEIGKEELEYANSKQVVGRIGEIAGQLHMERGLGENADPQEIVSIMKEAVKVLTEQEDPEAPSPEAFQTAMYIAEQINRVVEAAAESASDFEDLFNTVRPHSKALREAVSKATSLTEMREMAKQFADKIVKEIQERKGQVAVG